MHQLLERQIARYLEGDRGRLPADFLAAVDRSYREAEARGRLPRAEGSVEGPSDSGDPVAERGPRRAGVENPADEADSA
ncbi:MAG: hypothetical protein MI919_17735, partial [Holophagales bacterium]|nr:hypothetical protein [Holophagales bacterium]